LNPLRSLFIALSQNRPLRRFAEHSSIGRKLSIRFIAGLDVESALRAAAELNREGIAVSLDSLGENVYTEAAARRSADVYHRLLDAIADRDLNANVSLKLTQMGLDIDPAIARNITEDLVRHAVAASTFIRVDMESTEYTQITVDMTRAIHALPGNAGHIGTVMQAYLYRCESDIRALLVDGIRIRLCKGAYKEPPDKAFPEKKDVDANYVKLMKVLLTSGVYHGLATHDQAIIESTKRFAAEQKIDRSSFEFQMLYGIRRDLQRSLTRDGYNVRVYIPFGTEWYPYFMRRLAERPANALFIAKNLWK
jgi:proline dehydrogenase